MQYETDKYTSSSGFLFLDMTASFLACGESSDGHPALTIQDLITHIHHHNLIVFIESKIAASPFLTLLLLMMTTDKVTRRRES